MSEFEKYLKEHQAKLEVDSVKPEIWVGIENQILKQSSSKTAKRLGLVSIAAIMMLAFIIYQNFSSKNEVPTELLAQYGLEQMADIDKHIDSKIQLIKQTPVSKNHKDDVQLLLNQVAFLDELYQAKIDKTKSDKHSELLTSLLLEYYKNKSELLEKVLNEINKINTNEKEYKITNEKLPLNI